MAQATYETNEKRKKDKVIVDSRLRSRNATQDEHSDRNMGPIYWTQSDPIPHYVNDPMLRKLAVHIINE